MRAPTNAPDADGLFEAAFRHASVGMAVVGLDGRWLNVNDALCRIVGYGRDELLRIDFQSITHPDDLAADLDRLAEVQRGEGERYELEKRYIHRDGHVVWIHLTVSLVRFPDGRPRFFISQIQDIHRRRTAETDFESFFQLSPDLMSISTAAGVERVNPSWPRALGWSEDDLRQRPLVELIHPDDRAVTARESEAAFAGRPSPSFRNRLLARDGSYRCLDWKMHLGPDGRLYAVARDVTSQLAAEEALRRSAVRLAEISATAPAVLFQWYARATGERAFTFVSDRCEEIVGVDGDHLRPDWTGLPLAPDDAMRLQVSIRTAVTARAPWTCDVRAVRDGDVRWLRCHARPVLATRAEVRYSGVILDVTAERNAARALEASEERFRALAEGSIQGIVVMSLREDFRPLYANDAAARMFGFERAAEVTTLPSLASLAPADARADLIASWGQLLRAEISHLQGRRELRHRSGRPICVEMMGSLIVWEGEPVLQMTLVDVTERMRIEAELERLATTDPLTGLGNRRPFVEQAERELRRADRHPSPLALLLVDADHFKSINDRHGHAAGDEVLRALGGVLRGAVRAVDLVCRWGGEEFALMLVGSDLAGAHEVAERIRRNAASLAIPHEDLRLAVTVSVGVTVRRAGESALEAMVARADRALYAAKASGRNATADEP